MVFILKPVHLDKDVQVKSVLTISWFLCLHRPARLQMLLIHSSTDTEWHWLLLWVAFVPVCWWYRHFIPLLVLLWFQKSLAWIFNRYKERLWAARWIESRRRFMWWLFVSSLPSTTFSTFSMDAFPLQAFWGPSCSTLWQNYCTF